MKRAKIERREKYAKIGIVRKTENRMLYLCKEDNLQNQKKKQKIIKRKRERKLGETTEIDKVSVQNLKEKK